MKWSRRKFVAGGLIAGGSCAASAGAWLGLSSSRRARMLRQIVANVRREVPPAPVKPVPSGWNQNQITLAWLGHASVLIDFYGLRILTDPVLFEHIGVHTGLGTFGPKRLVQCGLTPAELPEIDLLLLSHAHLDHFDRASLRSVRGAPQVITAAETSDLLKGLALQNPQELRWSDATTVKTARGEVRIEAFEVKHWGRRWPRGKERGYNGYIIERGGRRILFGGDTAFTGSFAALKSRGPFAAALMPIGAYNPWIHSHCTPEEAVQMALAAGAEHIAPIHHATFKFSDEPTGEPLERFRTALAKESSRIAWRNIGESVSCA